VANPANDHLEYDDTGLNLTETSEGDKLTAYFDGGHVITIGYGHTGPDVHPGLVITQAQAQALLKGDIVRTEIGVKKYVNVPITQDEYDACVDLAFNIGLGNFQRSTLLRDLNANNFDGAAAQFHVWNRVAGKINSGLSRRRLAEEELFSAGIIKAVAPW
jgi:lysozyme